MRWKGDGGGVEMEGRGVIDGGGTGADGRFLAEEWPLHQNYCGSVHS